MNIGAKHHYRFEYLKSEHWDTLRTTKLTMCGCECLRCGHKDASNDVHHFQYRNLYDVELLDLAVLCRECHELVHSTMEDIERKLAAGEKTRLGYVTFLGLWPAGIRKKPEIQRALDSFRRKIYQKPKPIHPSTRKALKAEKWKDYSYVSVSVSLSRREHDALEVFAKNCGKTVQQCIRHAIGGMAKYVKDNGFSEVIPNAAQSALPKAQEPSPHL